MLRLPSAPAPWRDICNAKAVGALCGMAQRSAIMSCLGHGVARVTKGILWSCVAPATAGLTEISSAMRRLRQGISSRCQKRRTGPSATTVSLLTHKVVCLKPGRDRETKSDTRRVLAHSAVTMYSDGSSGPCCRSPRGGRGSRARGRCRSRARRTRCVCAGPTRYLSCNGERCRSRLCCSLIHARHRRSPTVSTCFLVPTPRDRPARSRLLR